MGDVTIFKEGRVANSTKRQPSELTKALSASNFTMRRIQASANGVFKRIVNGEQVGNPVRGEINVIIVGALPKVSRTFYSAKYDPNAEPTLPDCWSNLGDRPEPAASNPQSSNCETCKQNVKGSGDNGGRACRFQRRISVLLEDDPSGDVYQFNIPAKSLFGKGSGNVHPFESYTKFLAANNEDVDGVVTNISFNDNSDHMEFVFTPVRNLSDEEYELVQEAQRTPEASAYTKLTVAQADGVTKQPKADSKAEAKAKVVSSDEPDDEETVEPVKRARAKPESVNSASRPELASALQDWAEND